MSTLKGWLTAAEVAAILELHHSQVCRYCASGELPAIKLGNQWLIKPKDARTFKPNPVGNPALVRRAGR